MSPLSRTSNPLRHKQRIRTFAGCAYYECVSVIPFLYLLHYDISDIVNVLGLSFVGHTSLIEQVSKARNYLNN